MLRPDASVPPAAAGPANAPAPMARHAVPVVLGALLCVAGALLAGTPLDETLFRAVNAWGPLAPAAWSAFTVAGLASVAWIVVALARPHETRTAARMLWLVVVGGLAVHLVKHWAGATRPLGVLGEGVVHVVGSALRTGSMPSGHSATAIAMASLLVMESGWVTPRAVARSLASIALGVVICLSRIAVGAHWPSDVLVGAGLGLAVSRFAALPLAWPVPAMTRAFATPAGRRVVGLTLLLVLIEPFSETSARHYHDARWFAVALVPLALWGAWQRWRRPAAPVDA